MSMRYLVDSSQEGSIGVQAVISELFNEDSQPYYPAYDGNEFHNSSLTENHEKDFASLQNVDLQILNEFTPSQS